MDIDDITKFASRKRINADAEKLRERVSRETANIIKLKVAQDTAYWDLKEKLVQVESNHESLQQNMAEVQIQHEATNAKYQDELRRRPEILNKLSSTRKICDVLQESSERLRETLSRCKADGATLYDAFNRSAEQLSELQHKQRQADEKIKHQIENIQEKIALSKNHYGQLLQYLTSAKQQVDGELAEARGQLAAANARKDDLLTALGDINRELDKHKYEIAKKDETLTNLQSEMKRITDEYQMQSCNANRTIAQKDKDIQEAMEACTSLKNALSEQEEFTKSVCEKRNALQEQVAELQEKQLRLVADIDVLKVQLQDAASAAAAVEDDLETARNENNDLKKEIFDYIQELTNKKLEVQEKGIYINELQKEKEQMDSELRQIKSDSYEKSGKIDVLLTEKKQLEEYIGEMENTAKSMKESSEIKQKQLETKLESKEKEIETKTNAINSLMSEVKTVTDEKCKVEDNLSMLKNEMELERNAKKEEEEKCNNKIKMLQDCLRDKEAELSQNMSIILEIRNEKERLLSRIQDMQQTIDNAQKELTGKRRPTVKRYEPELDDDNAVLMTPSRSKVARQEVVQKQLEFVPSAGKLRPPETAAPAAPPAPPADVANHNSLFELFSDSSADDGKLNHEATIKRCFQALARGETLSRDDVASLKQRPNKNPRNQTQNQQFARGMGSEHNTKEDVITKPRKFFKHKRLETKK